MSRAWTKLIDKQVKDLTSTDLMKLTQLMYIDTRAIPEFESLQNLAAVSIGLTDGANSIILQKTTTVTASGPLTYVPPGNPIYLNELNYLSINNAASVNSHITVYCAIVARGGAQ